MRKITVVIERRADYSRFRPIMLRMKEDKSFKLHIIVTGLCLLPQHGHDIQYILNDRFTIDAQIPMFREDAPDTGAEMIRAMARFMPPMVDELERVKPDLVLSGFDIGANFAVTMAAAHMNIPVAHLQGGEITGSIDESIRHAMSKFAHIHLAATEQAKDRLIRMGERPDRIFTVGCPSIDTLVAAPKIPIKKLEKEFGFDFNKPVLLVIQHPVTTEFGQSKQQFEAALLALKKINQQTIILLPNNDAGYIPIVELIKNSGFKVIPSLSMELYANLLQHITVLVGNSSSGIHEAATFGVPVVNIGSRQQGREHGENVLDVSYKSEDIFLGIQKAMTDHVFRKKISALPNMYGDGRSAVKIVEILRNISLDSTMIVKKFYE